MKIHFITSYSLMLTSVVIDGALWGSSETYFVVWLSFILYISPPPHLWQSSAGISPRSGSCWRWSRSGRCRWTGSWPSSAGCQTGCSTIAEISTVQYSTIQYNTVQYSTVQYRRMSDGLLDDSWGKVFWNTDDSNIAYLTLTKQNQPPRKGYNVLLMYVQILYC